MSNKKLLSTVLAASLVATTMALPVMASGPSGTVDVEVGVKKNALRVQVPTRLAVEIDPYEAAQEGCQIFSDEFKMTNLSDINVEVKIDSKVTGNVVTNSNLVSSKDAAESSQSGDAWLAVAAKTQISGDAVKDYGVDSMKDLSETRSNVTTFNKSGDANQTYYLKVASGDPVYKTVTSGDVAEVGEYTEFYELGSMMDKSGDVIKEVEKNDVYVAESGDATKPLVKITRGAKSDDVTSKFTDGTNVAYVISGDALGLNAVKSGNGTYMYGEGGAVKEGKAQFRYIGKLSDSKEWVKADINKITINYTIKGVGPDTYNTKAENCIQGLYAAETGPQINVSATGLITMSGFTADKNYVSATLTNDNGTFDINAAPVDWDASQWSEENGGSLTGQLGDVWMDSLRGKTGTLKVTVTGDEVITATIAIP